MKKLIKWVIAIALITMIMNSIPTEEDGEIYGDTVRLHILANSDSTVDQNVKLIIRDEILKKYGKELSTLSSVSEAQEKIRSLLPKIKEDTEKWLSTLGYSYSVDASLGEEWYETREYSDFTLPCGRYLSLKIILGEGDGQNWWCVMYPPMCLDMACERAPGDDGVVNYSKEEILLISGGKYNVKFKILEELSRAFSKNS